MSTRSILIGVFLLCAALGELSAATGTIVFTEFKSTNRSLSVRFTGELWGFPKVSSFAVHRSSDIPDREWEELVKLLMTHTGRKVQISISGGAFASRGSHLSYFRKPKVFVAEVK